MILILLLCRCQKNFPFLFDKNAQLSLFKSDKNGGGRGRGGFGSRGGGRGGFGANVRN